MLLKGQSSLTLEGSYQCKDCTTMFKTRTAFRKHHKNPHKKADNTKLGVIQKSSRVNECDKSFIKNADLEIHKKNKHLHEKVKAKEIDAKLLEISLAQISATLKNETLEPN